MRRFVSWSLAVTVLSAAPAAADPGVTVSYRDEQLRVTLNGSYAGALYQVWRSDERIGIYDPLLAQVTLCTGDCFVHDLEAIPGATYFYRFEVQSPEGRVDTYGPYPVTVPDRPLEARVSPNPSIGPVRVDLSLPGSGRRDAPLDTEATVVDLQGRTVRRLYTGPLARGVTAVTWDGRGDDGRRLGAGLYFVRFTTPIGSSIARVVRFR